MPGLLDQASLLRRVHYQGLVTFWRADYSQDLGEAEFAVYGVANDSEIVNRPLSLIHFDAHTDTHEGPYLNHGSMFWYAAKEGLIDPETSIQIGIRTLIPDDDGFTVLTSHECIEMGTRVIDEAIPNLVGERRCSIALDVADRA